ncbi:unnamed protein product [Camellia sinensis]
MEFCMRITKHLLLQEVGKSIKNNLVLSPLSINVVLNMVAARLAGPALEHVMGHLGFKTISDIHSNSSEIMAVAAGDGENGGPVFTMVNGVWVDKEFALNPSYEKVLRERFDCEFNTVDFRTQAEEVIEEVNTWAEKASRGLITNILEPSSLDPMTQLVLANGLYFKGTWSKKFDANLTQNRNFYLLNGDKISTPFMSNRKDYLFRSFNDFKVLKIPYHCGNLKSLVNTKIDDINTDDSDYDSDYDNTNDGTPRFSMFFLLPNKIDGLPNLLEKLNSDCGLLDQSLMNLWKAELNKFWIPKFKFSFDFKVCKAMEDMGVSLNVKSETVVSTILHKACVEIDEVGTEAAAITVSMLMGCSLYEPEKVNFVADHPFLFMIKEEVSGLVIFAGAVLNPAEVSF